MKRFFIFALLFIVTTTLVSAATIQVEKRGGGDLGPFAIDVTCIDYGNFSFSLAAGETGSFSYPEETTINCFISETMTSQQSFALESTVGDTWGDDDGIISGSDSSLVDGQTLYVTNTFRGGGKASSINSSSVASSIPESPEENTPDMSVDTGNNLIPTGPSVSLLVLQDPYTCGAGFVGAVSSDNLSSTTVTIDLQQSGKSVKVFTPSVGTKGIYSQSINYTDQNSSTYVVAGSYEVTITAQYNGMTDSMSYTTNITNQCDIYTSTPNPSYLDMLRERNAKIVGEQTTSGSVKKPEAPKSLPKTGAEIL